MAPVPSEIQRGGVAFVDFIEFARRDPLTGIQRLKGKEGKLPFKAMHRVLPVQGDRHH